MQGHGHYFGCEAEGIFHTCRENREEQEQNYESVKKSGLNLILIIDTTNKQNRQKKGYLFEMLQQANFFPPENNTISVR